ncbi:MAG TPA: hypothetical protein VMV69_08365, partial [Pirellulales bacterium]|nr:hypothetical protein [Pirellulales bacterium]
LACQQLVHGRLRSVDAIERLVKTTLNQPLSEPLDRSRPTRERLGNTFVSPIRSIGVGLQQNLGTPNLLTRPLQFLDYAAKLAPLLIRQSHYVPFLHGTPPCATQNRRFARISQPDILAVTKH